MIEVLNPGLFTSVQDEGRYGYRSKGIPVSGAMDQQAYHFSNFLLNNAPGAPVFEFTQMGPTLHFHARSTIVLTGGKYEATLNGDKVPYATPFTVPAGSQLEIGRLLSGNYGYLSIEGGFHTHKVLGSSSYCPNVNESAKCKKGSSFVFIRSMIDHERKNAQVRFDSVVEDVFLDVYPGPEFEQLSTKQKQVLFNSNVKISTNSSRMAIQLDHQLELGAKDIITAPVQPGTVQLTPGGNLIVLMRDAQTTGGYARVLQLSSDSINQLAQIGPSKEIRFSKP